MAHPDTPDYDAWLDPHTVAVVHALLRASLASATMHLDLEEHDEFYNRLRRAISHWQREPLLLPEPMTLKPRADQFPHWVYWRPLRCFLFLCHLTTS